MVILTLRLQEVEKPAPIEISVSELLKKVQKPQKKIIKQGLATIEKNCKLLFLS